MNELLHLVFGDLDCALPVRLGMAGFFVRPQPSAGVRWVTFRLFIRLFHFLTPSLVERRALEMLGLLARIAERLGPSAQ